MGRLEWVEVAKHEHWVATCKVEIEAESTLSSSDAELKIAAKLRDRAEVIEHKVEREA